MQRSKRNRAVLMITRKNAFPAVSNSSSSTQFSVPLVCTVRNHFLNRFNNIQFILKFVFEDGEYAIITKNTSRKGDVRTHFPADSFTQTGTAFGPSHTSWSRSRSQGRLVPPQGPPAAASGAQPPPAPRPRPRQATRGTPAQLSAAARGPLRRAERAGQRKSERSPRYWRACLTAPEER